MRNIGKLSAATVIGLSLAMMPGCEKAKGDGTKGNLNEDSNSGLTAEQRRSASLADVSARKKEMDERIIVVEKDVAKLGNKTRKRLKPKLDSMEVHAREVREGVEKLKSLQEIEFIHGLEEVRASLDSVTKRIEEVRKYLK